MQRAQIALFFIVASTAATAAETLTKPVRIPIEIVKGFPVLVARIGERDLPLMFDLGGYESITLTQEAMRVAGVVPLHDDHATWKDAKGNVIEAAGFTVKELRIGDAVFNEVDGHVEAFDESFKPTSPLGNVGHIGAALVRSYKVVLDYRAGTMTLIPGDDDDETAAQAGCRGAVVPFASEFEGEPVSKAKTDLGALTFVWDTGAPTSIIRRSLVAAPAAETPPQDPYRSGAFELGGADFGPLDLRLFDFEEPAGVDGFVGANFFAARVVCVDFPRSRFLVR